MNLQWISVITHCLFVLLFLLVFGDHSLFLHSVTYRMRSHGCTSYWGAGCKQLQQLRRDRKFRSSVSRFTNWVVFLAVDLVLGSTRRPFNLYFEVCLKALRFDHTDKNRLWLLCVLSSIVRSDLNVQLRCASSSTSTVSSVSLCIVHRDRMLSVSSSNIGGIVCVV
jgi:hypothetical protein